MNGHPVILRHPRLDRRIYGLILLALSYLPWAGYYHFGDNHILILYEFDLVLWLLACLAELRNISSCIQENLRQPLGD